MFDVFENMFPNTQSPHCAVQSYIRCLATLILIGSSSSSRVYELSIRRLSSKLRKNKHTQKQTLQLPFVTSCEFVYLRAKKIKTNTHTHTPTNGSAQLVRIKKQQQEKHFTKKRCSNIARLCHKSQKKTHMLRHRQLKR